MISDGCRSTSKEACINVLLTTAAGTKFLQSIAATEETKDMRYIAKLINAHIEEIGASRITAVIMDEACAGSFVFITQKFPHVQCFICPTHSLDFYRKHLLCETLHHGQGSRYISMGGAAFLQGAS